MTNTEFWMRSSNVNTWWVKPIKFRCNYYYWWRMEFVMSVILSPASASILNTRDTIVNILHSSEHGFVWMKHILIISDANQIQSVFSLWKQPFNVNAFAFDQYWQLFCDCLHWHWLCHNANCLSANPFTMRMSFMITSTRLWDCLLNNCSNWEVPNSE